MSTGLFSEEEDDYLLDETKYKLKVDAPKSDAQPTPTPDFGDEMDSEPSFGSEEAPKDDNPFDKEPFDAGIEVDEKEDPKKFIQQLAGKIGQSLREYEKELGNPDFELEKFVINSVISATNTADMDKNDQKDIIDKIETSGADKDVNTDETPEEDIEVDAEAETEETVEEMSLGDDIEEIFAEWSKPMEIKEAVTVSEGLKYHLDNKISLGESVFRYGSEKYIKLIKEVKSLYKSGIISLNENDEFIVNSATPSVAFVDGKDIILNTIYEEEEEIMSEDEMVDNLPTFTQIAALGIPVLASIIRSILKGNDEAAKKVLNKELKDKNPDSVNEALKSIKGIIKEAEYKGKDVELNKPKRGGSKKFYVYVKDPQSGNIRKVSFGAKSGGGNLAVKLKDPKARKAFSDRHNCPEKTDKTTPGYWACALPRFAKSLGLSGGGRYW
jgi:hypothetical protein